MIRVTVGLLNDDPQADELYEMTGIERKEPTSISAEFAAEDITGAIRWLRQVAEGMERMLRP